MSIWSTLELYAEQVPKHEREVAKTMDAFVKAALGDEAPEEQSLDAFREAIATLPPSEWPDWVREIADLVGGKLPQPKSMATTSTTALQRKLRMRWQAETCKQDNKLLQYSSSK